MTTAAANPEVQEPIIVPHPVTLELYRKMLTVYYVEERLKVFDRQGKCSFHASTRGHEKVQVGLTMLLKPRHDWFFTYYRSKGVVVGLGMPLKDIFLAMLSREGDPNSNGRNMPEQFSSRELKLVAQTACTGTQYLPAVGMARALKRDGAGQVVYVSSGEGATSEGEFFEALNWAGREKLPVLFVVENNGYAISVPQEVQTGSEVHRIAQGFAMPTYNLDGTWFEPMYQTIPPVIERLRRGEGPALIEAHVIRLDPHSSSDDQRKYRSPEELEALRQRDPIYQTEQYLLRHRVMNADEMDALRAEIKAEVDRAAAEADAQPAPSGRDLLAHIYSDEPAVGSPPPAPRYLPSGEITMIDAINHGLREEMERNPKIVMWGEDIADPKGGVFGVTRGLTTAFPGRVENSPLAEASIVGVAGGVAIAGYKPIVEIQFGDYLWPGFMQMRDEIATVRWRSQGAWTCPVVVRIAVGGYIKGGPWHSACVESFFAHVPGWRVVFPSCADDAKGLIKTAARSADPVVFLEHKGLYRRIQAKTPEPDANYLVPFGCGRVRREGKDVTVVAWGSAIYLALEAARQLEPQGYSVEIIDPRSIIPLDEQLIYRSVRKTSRLVIASEDSLTMGFAAEIAARVAQNCIDALDAPILRVAAQDSFVPSAPSLEAMVLPSAESVKAAVEQVLRY
ncbi:MAG TPA: dehydrogenase E1 component subunit alpha/beta [Bryobacteraceae bacterium]|nr:dehydrogenase E1 component subunit alpha/beta [Bryobacteraceae bacterium]